MISIVKLINNLNVTCLFGSVFNTRFGFYNRYHNNRINDYQKSSLFVLVFLLFTLILPIQNCTSFKKQSKITLEKNGYRDIIVGIEDGVKENPELIDRIKETFSEASSFLFNITKKRVYFHAITIVVPASWKLDYYFNSAKETFDSKLLNATWQSYDIADFCIEERDDFTIETPFVVNYAANCGESGSNINLTPDYFLNKNRAIKLFGPYSNVIVHNWARFRYGVFSEAPNKNLDNNEEFYFNVNGDIEATRCNINITGHIRNPIADSQICDKYEKNGLPSVDCIYEDDIKPKLVEKRVGSLMYRPFLTQLNEFCDNNPNMPNTLHNKFAPTIQNKECDGKSVWEVMRNHEDFIDFKNMPNNQIYDQTPLFYIFKKRMRKTILLIDKSIKTKLPTYFPVVERTITDYIKLMLKPEDLLSIIHFQNNAKVVVPLTLKDPIAQDRILKLAIPKTFNNKTSNIWNAISLALTVLRNSIGDKTQPTGGNIIVITNSLADPNYPNINLVQEQIRDCDVTLDLIRINDKSDQLLEELSESTNGLTCMIKSDNYLLDVEDAFIKLSNRNLRNSKKSIKLFDELVILNGPGHVGVLHIDESLSSRTDANLKISFSVDNLKDFLEMVVYEPNGKRHQSKLNLKCKDSSLFATEFNKETIQNIVCEFKRPKFGKWTYEIKDNSNQGPIGIKVKANVYFQDQFIDESSYYSNYYEREDYYKLKKYKKDVTGNVQSSILVEGKWSKDFVKFPEAQIIFAKLSRGLKPILNATVKAHIFRPTGDFISIELFDDGLYADRFKDDGIYSRYFTNFNMDGSYYAQIHIKSNPTTVVNMQKIVGTPDFEHYPTIGIVNKINLDYLTSPIHDIQRVISVDSFILDNYLDSDSIKPAKIKDLKVVETNHEKNKVKFTFSAPGDDADVGNSEKYEILTSYDPNLLLDENEERVLEGEGEGEKIDNTNENKNYLPIIMESSSFESFKPNIGRTPEFFVLKTESYNNFTFSIKIRAIDFSNNTGPWSQILTVKINPKISLSAQLRHFSSDSVIIEKKDLVDARETVYSKFFVGFVVGLGIILLIQLVFFIILAVYKIKQIKDNKFKPVRV